MAVTPYEYLTLPAGESSNYICKGIGPIWYGIPCCWNYRRVRLIFNGTSIYILRADRRFITTSASGCLATRGHEIAGYGSAGGCNSSATGEFKIDLTGTVFRIPGNAFWIPGGARKKIANFSKSDDGQIVSARCGGNCGGCNPSSGPTYLPLDLTCSY